MRVLWVVVGCLGVPGLLPAVVLVRRSPALIFLAPLVGAVMAASAACVEVGVGGSLAVSYVGIAVVVNLAAAIWWLSSGRFRRQPDPPPWGWSVLTVAVVLGALALPLAGLDGHMIGGDTNAIWLTHALLLSGGHHQALQGLQNPAYRFSNPDYPPLVPAAGALAFALFGRGDLQLAVDVTVALNACGVAAAAVGIAALAGKARVPVRAAAIAAAGIFCVTCFAVSGTAGIDGYADLTWAAAAVAAVIWGLVLPPSRQALAVAWICAAAASLTKNEGFTTALIVIVLVAFRYLPMSLRSPARAGRHAGPTPARAPHAVIPVWAQRSMMIIVPALPGLAWAGIARSLGLHDAFFASSSPESLGYRAGATIVALADNLAIVPVALAVLAIGSALFRRDRERAEFGNPAWLWTVAAGSLSVIFATYLLGSLGIHRWLEFSVARTTIFTRSLMYADLAIWLVIAVEAVSRPARTRYRGAEASAPAQAPASVPLR
jgi:hypothetical protein